MANMIQERLKFERVLRDRIERQGEWVKRYSDIPLIREQDVKVSSIDPFNARSPYMI